MLGKIIISILFIPINAIILWAASGFISECKSYKIALLSSSLLYLISLLYFVPFQGKGFFISTLFYFIGSWWFIILLSGFVLWLIYRYDLADLPSAMLILALCVIPQISSMLILG